MLHERTFLYVLWQLIITLYDITFFSRKMFREVQQCKCAMLLRIQHSSFWSFVLTFLIDWCQGASCHHCLTTFQQWQFFFTCYAIYTAFCLYTRAYTVQVSLCIIRKKNSAYTVESYMSMYSIIIIRLYNYDSCIVYCTLHYMLPGIYSRVLL